MSLTKEDLAVISEVFTQAYVLDLPEKWDEEYEEDPAMNENFTSKRFSEVWDKISASI